MLERIKSAKTASAANIAIRPFELVRGYAKIGVTMRAMGVHRDVVISAFCWVNPIIRLNLSAFAVNSDPLFFLCGRLQIKPVGIALYDLLGLFGKDT